MKKYEINISLKIHKSPRKSIKSMEQISQIEKKTLKNINIEVINRSIIIFIKNR
jgi:hypothetical protein